MIVLLLSSLLFSMSSDRLVLHRSYLYALFMQRKLLKDKDSISFNEYMNEKRVSIRMDYSIVFFNVYGIRALEETNQFGCLQFLPKIWVRGKSNQNARFGLGSMNSGSKKNIKKTPYLSNSMTRIAINFHFVSYHVRAKS